VKKAEERKNEGWKGGRRGAGRGEADGRPVLTLSIHANAFLMHRVIESFPCLTATRMPHVGGESYDRSVASSFFLCGVGRNEMMEACLF